MPPRVLWIGDSPTISTGYGRATREIVGRLHASGYIVACLGRAYDGWPYDVGRYPYPIFPTGAEYLGLQSIGRVLDVFKPEIIVAYGDLWMVEWINEIHGRQRYCVIGYVPIDGGPLPISWRKKFKAFDRLVTTSVFGRDQLTQLLPELQVELIYHGVDLASFRPLSHRDQLREMRSIPRDVFVVGCIARNQRRKQLPMLLEAFSKFQKRIPDSILYLHTSDEPQGWVLPDFIAQYRLAHSVRFTPGLTTSWGVSDDELNAIYNVFDVMVLPTAGEGFGLPILEAMAAGIPVAATEFSACIELLEGRGELIKTKARCYLGPQVIQNVIIDVDDLVERLCKLYEDGALRAAYVKSGLDFARGFDWKLIADRWDNLLSSI